MKFSDTSIFSLWAWLDDVDLAVTTNLHRHNCNQYITNILIHNFTNVMKLSIIAAKMFYLLSVFLIFQDFT